MNSLLNILISTVHPFSQAEGFSSAGSGLSKTFAAYRSSFERSTFCVITSHVGTFTEIV